MQKFKSDYAEFRKEFERIKEEVRSPLVLPFPSPNLIYGRTSAPRHNAPSCSPRALAHLSHPALGDGASPRGRYRRRTTRRRRTRSAPMTAAPTRTWVRAGKHMRCTSTSFYVTQRRGWTNSWRRGGRYSTAWSISGRCSRARSAACATRRTRLGLVGRSLVGSNAEGARCFVLFHDDVF